MNKNAKKKNKLIKKIFIIPVIIWIILGIMTIISEDNISTQETLRWSDLAITTIIIVIPWMCICYFLNKLFIKKEKNSPSSQYTKEYGCDVISLKQHYIYECSVNEKEYSKLADYFPVLYLRFIIIPIALNIIVTAILYLLFNNISICLIYLTLSISYALIYHKINLKKNLVKEFNKNSNKFEKKYFVEFHNDFVIKKYNNKIEKIPYEDISKAIKTPTNLYLTCSNKKIIIIQLNNGETDEELSKFLNNKICLVNNNDKLEHKHINILNTIMIVLFIGTILSLFGAIYTFGYYCENIDKLIYSSSKNLWIFWCWLPIPVISIILGNMLKKYVNTKKNIILGILISILLLIIGSFSFTSTFETEYTKIYDYSKFIGFTLPAKGRLEIIEWTNWNNKNILEYTSIIGYFDKEDRVNIEKEIRENKNWIMKGNLHSNLNEYKDLDIYSNEEVYYSIYNKTLNIYNTFPKEKGIYEIYIMKYVLSEGYIEIKKCKYTY